MEQITVPKIDVLNMDDFDNGEIQRFSESAMDEIVDRLDHNHNEAYGLTDVEKSVEEVLDSDNVRTLDIRAKRLENPKVTLWLKDCPVWANDAWTTTIHPEGINSYNGKVTVTFDVRPF